MDKHPVTFIQGKTIVFNNFIYLISVAGSPPTFVSVCRIPKPEIIALTEIKVFDDYKSTSIRQFRK